VTTLLKKKSKDLRGTWFQALASLFGAILFILAIRWALFEPYVIPSGSMIPTLLIHDHIFVNKFAYGVRLPFANRYVIRFTEPKRGDVLVFRSVEDDDMFLVKRVVGLPGDEVQLKSDGLYINGVKAPTEPYKDPEALLKDWTPDARNEALAQNEILEETLGDGPTAIKHAVFRDKEEPQPESPAIKVPADHLFMSGDNRDHSADSRMWGTLPVDRVLGRASIIWLSCEEAMAQTNQLCNLQTMRWNRLFKSVR
jgi:signal peptidase I